jgi:hypothetical protein
VYGGETWVVAEL